jgi:hypothetical protein
MLVRLLAPRAAAQARLLAGVLALVTVGVTLLGLAALLLGSSQPRGLDVAMARATPEQVDVTAYVAGVPATAAAGVVRDSRSVLADVLRPLPTATSAQAFSALRELAVPGGPAVAYLGAVEDLGGRARLVAGRRPAPGAAVPEVAVPQVAAARLGLAPGGTLRLGKEVAGDARARPVVVRVVGVFAPTPGPGWARDPLGGAGTDPRRFASPRLPAVPAYGPFVLDLADLTGPAGGGSSLDRLEVTGHPDLSRPAGAALDGVIARFGSANPQLTARLHGRVSVERIDSALPATVANARTQESATRAAVLVVVLLGTTLTATALALAGRLVAALRGDETALLASLGGSRRQLVATAAIEAAALAAVATALALPLAGLLHAAVTRWEPVRRAGLVAGPSVTPASVAAVAAGALLLAGLLVVPALRPEHGVAATTRGRAGVLVRSGADVLAVVLAVVGWWQLRAQPAVGSGVDAVRVVAPVLCLVAGALAVLRAVPPLLRAGDRLARRSRTLVLPLAAFEAARRPQAVAAGLLVALGAAAGTFGVAFGVTWDRAMHDQADLRVGTDLRVSSPGDAGEGSVVAAATGGTVSPATRRNVLVGQWLGDPGRPPQLVALDASRAGGLIRGGPPGDGVWAGLGAPDRVAGLPLRPGAVPTVSGTATGTVPVTALPRLVLQDSAGVRFVREGAPVPLDGRRRPLRLTPPVPAGSSVVAVGLQVSADPAAVPLTVDGDPGASALTVDVRLPAPAVAARAWPARAIGTETALAAPSARLVPGGAGAVVRMSTVASLVRLAYGAPGQLVATAFPQVAALPAAVSADLLAATGTRVGGRMQVTVGTTSLPVTVVRSVPEVPSVPGVPGLLADADLLSRALIGAGDLTPATNGWWIGHPTAPDAEARLRALGLGPVVSRVGAADELAAGPLRVVFPVALAALVPVALLLVVAGTALAVTADLDARAVELAQLRAVGLRRSDVRRGLLAQHGGVLLVLLAAGAAVGAGATRLLAPVLVRSDTGGLPVPAVRPLWPWGAEGALLAAYVVGCLAVASVVVVRRVRRSDPTALRAGAA